MWKYPVTDHSPTYSGSPILDDPLYRQSNPYSSVSPYEYSSYTSPRQAYFSQQSYYSPTAGSHEYLSNTCTPSTSTNTISSLSFSQDNKTDLTLPAFQWSTTSSYMGANMWDLHIRQIDDSLHIYIVSHLDLGGYNPELTCMQPRNIRATNRRPMFCERVSLIMQK